jgi:hypothetical protein
LALASVACLSKRAILPNSCRGSSTFLWLSMVLHNRAQGSALNACDLLIIPHGQPSSGQLPDIKVAQNMSTQLTLIDTASPV